MSSGCRTIAMFGPARPEKTSWPRMYLRRESPSSPCERMTTSRLCRVPDIKRNRLHLLGLRPNYLTGYKKRFMRWALPVYTAGMSTADSSKQYDAIILGAGASGLYCAMTAAGRGRRVLILDHAAKPGRKLSITGGGKCNLGNRTVGPEIMWGKTRISVVPPCPASPRPTFWN